MTALSAGSSIKNTVISNKSNIKNSANTSIGGLNKSEANQGSIVTKGANLNNSTIVNNTTIKNSANIAAGGEANQGVIKISRPLRGVTIVNKASIRNSTNAAVDVLGTGNILDTNKSQQGSIIFK